MRYLFLAIIVFTSILTVKSQKIESFYSYSNNRHELSDNIHGFGLGLCQDINSKFSISLSFQTQFNEVNYIHTTTSSIINPTTPIFAQTNFSFETSRINSKTTNLTFLYILSDNQNSRLSFGPDLAYTYWIGYGSFYDKKFKRHKIGIGAQLKLEMIKLFQSNFGIFTSVTSQYLVGIAEPGLDFDMYEPYLVSYL